MRRLLITGASGLLGANFARIKSADYIIHGTYLTYPLHEKTKKRRPSPDKPFLPFPIEEDRLIFLDLRDEKGTAEAFEEARPDIVIHTAAVTDPVYAEENPDECREVNVQATAFLADLCRAKGARLVFISTDIVFDGLKGGYTEEDVPSPLHVYGRSKVEAEGIIQQRCPDSLIVRTSILLGRSPREIRAENERIVTRALSGEAVRLFTDEYRSFIWVEDLVEAIDGLLRAGASGLFHAAGPEKLSRFQLGALVLSACRRTGTHILPITLDNWSGSPPRAPDVSLDTAKLRRTIDIIFHRAAEALDLIYGRRSCR